MIYDYSGNVIDSIYTHTVPREQIFVNPVRSDIIWLEAEKDGVTYAIRYGYEGNCTIHTNGQPHNMCEYRYMSHGGLEDS